jgi:DNA helicase II / ATP-dependent DNA helicase PcrA
VSSIERELELQDERVTERRYAEQLRKDERNRPRPYFFAGTKVPQLPDAVVGRFVGRVALRDPDELLGQRNDFYLGEKHTNVDGVEVYSWSAPIACSFFRNNHRHDAYEGLGELCAGAVVIRSFRHVNGQIVDFADDILAPDVPPHPFPKRGLAIPTAPRRAVPRPKPPPAMPAGASDQGESDEPLRHEDANGHRQSLVDGEGIRAESLLRAQLHAPRAKGLGPVLSTLQADQYELVTVPAMDSMVIEGKPGTGKTIIASHRAAYIVNDQTPAENSLDGKVLIVGPTPEYSRHIRDVIGRLADNRERVIVLSMPELMREILGARNDPRGPNSNNWQDVEWTLGRLSRSAIGRHRASHGVTPTVEDVYECLRMNRATGRPVTQDPEWSGYLRTLPPYKEARGLRAHWPLLAFIAWEVAPSVDLRKIEHIIVDEAQDVTEMEWFLLQAINEAHAWTILGDLNQRRSDHTHASWEKILDVLTVDVDTPIRRLKRGYRSTKPILEYANRLLPREQRSTDAFQYGGVSPAVVRTRPQDVGSAVAAEIERLTANHPAGTVAVISVQPDHVRKALRGAGWSAVSYDLKRWEHNGTEVTVVEPDSARGLEFDAVIVVEPADFPTNYGRQGPLYTALTRGNRELAVVHSKPLPDSLRRK